MVERLARKRCQDPEPCRAIRRDVAPWLRLAGGHDFHVNASAVPLLSKDRTHRWLVEAIDAARYKERFDLWAYVIMPEHSRILWRIKQPVGQKAIAYLEQTSERWLNQVTVMRADGRRERRFWQAGGGYDRNVNEAPTLLNVIEYIHQNPVHRGLVQRPED
ncbi:MAG: hypothetical protein NVSMB9_21450 [Isosphaeraceae bacterium]